MVSFPQLKLPQAWKPLFKALDGIGWHLKESFGPQTDWSCSHLLSFVHESGLPVRCYLSFLEGAEWCGDNFNNNAMTIAAFSFDFPKSRAAAEILCFPLIGDWESDLNECMRNLEKSFFDFNKAINRQI